MHSKHVLWFCIVFLLLGISQAMAATYYVSTIGDNANSGLSEAAPWRTVTYAAMSATAGDTVYVKAGLYQGETPAIRNSGTAGSPIVFQGYQNTTGDTPLPDYLSGNTLNPAVLPVLDNIDPAIRVWVWGAGFLLDWYKPYITIRNFAINNYNYGIFAQHADHVTIENVYITNQGTNGINFRDSTDVHFRNLVISDASMCNYLFERCQDSVIENCLSYAITYDPDPTDYHIVLQYSQNITVQNCKAFNLHWEHTGSHTGHGIGIKDIFDGSSSPHSTDCQFINCEAYNLGEYFFVAQQAYNNQFINCTAIGQYQVQNYWSEGINIRDGAHDNTFRNCRIEGIRTSVTLQDTIEGPEYPAGTPVPQICSNNTLINCIFKDSDEGIEIFGGDNNLFQNCVFNGAGAAILVEFVHVAYNPLRNNLGNRARNCIFTNIPGGLQSDGSNSGSIFSVSYSDFWNNNFSVPTGIGNLSVDPLFANAAGGDYHLKSQTGRWNNTAWVQDAVSSPCIDAGDPADDWSTEPNPNGDRINIGAYGGTSEASKGAAGRPAPPRQLRMK